MVQPHFLGPSSYPRPLAYPPYSPPQPRPGVIRALGPTPGVRRRPCEQVRSRKASGFMATSGILGVSVSLGRTHAHPPPVEVVRGKKEGRGSR